MASPKHFVQIHPGGEDLKKHTKFYLVVEPTHSKNSTVVKLEHFVQIWFWGEHLKIFKTTAQKFYTLW